MAVSFESANYREREGWGFKHWEIVLDGGRVEGGGLWFEIEKKNESGKFWLTKVIIFVQINDKSLVNDKSDNFQTKVIVTRQKW